MRSRGLKRSPLFVLLSFVFVASLAVLVQPAGSPAAQAAGECPAGWTYESGTGTCFRSFTTTGANTWTPPAGVTSANYFIVGGGGGGQGQSSCSNSCKGGQGGTRATGSITFAASTSLTVTVGAGGSQNSAGSASSVVQGASTLATAAGGAASYQAGAGTGTGGVSSFSGTSGTYGANGGASTSAGGTNAGSGASSGTDACAGGGAGTANFGGGGGGGDYCPFSFGGGANTVAGSGGSGVVMLRYTAFGVSSFTTAVSSTTNSSSFSYSLAFSGTIDATTLTASDFSNGGTSTGCVFTPSPSTGTSASFTVTVTGCGDGTVVPTLASGSVTASTGTVGPGSAATGPSTTVDTTPPSAPGAPDLATGSDSGTSSTDDVTSDTTPTFSVSGGASGETATITATNGVTTKSCTYVIGSASSCDLPALTDGTWTVSGTLTDSAGNVSAAGPSTSVTVDTTAPSAPAAPDLVAASDSGASDTDNVTSDTTPALSLPGATVGDTVEFTASNGVTTKTCSYVAGSATSCDLPVLSSGNWSVTARVTDPAGNQSTAGPALPLTVDTTAPVAPGTPDLASSSDTGTSSTDNLTSDTTPTMSASGGSAGDTMTITASNGSTTKSCTYVIGSATSCDLPALTDGSWTISARLTDPAGNTSSAGSGLGITVDGSAPSVASGPDLASSSDTGSSSTDDITSDATPTVSVSGGTSGDVVTLVASNGSTSQSCTYVVGSATSCDLPALTGGTWSVSGTITDAAGNVAVALPPINMIVDTTAPVPGAPDVSSASDTGSSASDNLTSDSTPNVSVPGVSAGDQVTVTASNGSTTRTCSYTVGSATSCDLPALTDGTWTLSAAVTDAAGNTGTTASTSSLVIDTSAPSGAGPVDLAASSDTGSSSSDDATADTTPTFSMSGGAVGDTATVTATNGTTTASCSYIIGSATSCDLPVLTDGAWTVSGTLTDAAGNVSTAGPSMNLTIDATAPVVPAKPDLAAASDTGASSTDDVTADSMPFIDVPGVEVGATVTVTATKSGVTVTCTYVVAAGTTGCELPLLADGAWSVTATATDARGNSSTTGALELRIDTSKPFGGITVTTGTTGSGSTAGNNKKGRSGGGSTTTTTVPSGNKTTKPRGTAVNVPTSVPKSPAGTPDLRTSSDTGVDPADNVTSDRTPRVGIEGLSNGDALTLTAQQGATSFTCSYVVGKSDGCDMPELADGTWTLTASVIDLAGNTADAPGSLEFTVGPEAPVEVPVVTSTVVPTTSVAPNRATDSGGSDGGESGPLHGEDTIRLIASMLALAAIARRRSDEPRHLGDDDRSASGVAEFAAGSGSGGLDLRSDAYVPPRWDRLDDWMCAVAARSARFSPALGRVLDDGSYLRALVGVLWPVIPAIGAVLGVVAAGNSDHVVTLPALGLFIALLVVGALDAFAGMAAATSYLVSMLLCGGMDSADALRGFLGLAAAMFLVGLIASAMRPYRRVSAGDHLWNRFVDVVLITLIGAWSAGTMFSAVPHLSGYDVAWSGRVGAVEVAALATLLVRWALENAARILVSVRLARIENETFPSPVAGQRLVSRTVRTIVFAFVAWVFVGGNWWLAAGSAMFLVPKLIETQADRFPNSPVLHRMLPRNLVRIVVMLFVMLWWGLLVDGAVSSNDVQWAFVLMSIPGLCLGVADWFARDGEEWPSTVLSRLLGAVTLVVGVALVRGWLP